MAIINILSKIKNSFKIGTIILYKFKENSTSEENLKSQANIQIKKVTWNNILDSKIHESQSKIEIFKKFLSEGDRGYYAYLNKRWAHRSWVTFGRKEVDLWAGTYMKNLSEDEAFIHWCETAPWAKGKGIYPLVLTRIVKDINKKYKKIYISTIKKNISSQKGIIKAGFREVKRIKVIKIFKPGVYGKY